MRFTHRLYPISLAALLFVLAPLQALAENLKEIRLDFAYYSPESLVVKKNHWLEDTFNPKGTQVRWVLSRGSNNSLEFLNGGSTDFALTSSISAFVSRANGQPVKAVYSYLWYVPSILLVQKDSPLKTVTDLKGKKIAATKGTDPYFFLLRALDANHLKPSDVSIVHLQHPDGRTALEQGRVDAWAGLDPHLAAAQLAGAKTLYENPAFGVAAFLNTQEAFLKAHPDAVSAVIQAYDKARRWIIANPDAAVKLIAAETQLPEDVIALQLGRYDFTQPLPGQKHLDAIKAVIPLLQADRVIRTGADTDTALNTLIDSALAKPIVEEK
ncbi:sulfonate transport system substrate-binding protein [Gibbsiella quercinecans]|uniref:Putative aliphatic sulfonates-binding protein n=1 Tax=Gibbsiella quercinecans TaxID=929813 RepID=A0A250AZK0_9GAMM|nr:aliphatic sulfonate ABC transporter substrate-binding protein [Gibbsiella quercinecans]ATA19132.1 sulfonate ABC transporter substrate-binding protein [Gibbsiella quercinecans]RLM03717.1 sulfonate ABC transporter substrate-binding protein [Gibbsiella quercinecans]RLM10954.1 sulfonate ABC transporter substrate-binding protein [Gibbsiella quercinecans]TCT87638.1 sulfonate transport system substrate-binding protein [Gibbsiella quercinecans]